MRTPFHNPPQLARILLTTSILLSALACESEDEHEHEAETPESEACEHLTDGPASPVTASATEDASGADISASHRRFDITLPGDGDKKGGYVQFISASAGDHLLVLNGAVPVQVLDSQGNVVTAKSEATSQAGCASIQSKAVYTLGVATYRLKLGPTSSASVGALLESM